VIENLGRHDQVCNLWNQAIERCNFIHTGGLDNTDPMYEGSLLARFWDHRGLDVNILPEDFRANSNVRVDRKASKKHYTDCLKVSSINEGCFPDATHRGMRWRNPF
jgi:hypothetical protein